MLAKTETGEDEGELSGWNSCEKTKKVLIFVEDSEKYLFKDKTEVQRQRGRAGDNEGDMKRFIVTSFRSFTLVKITMPQCRNTRCVCVKEDVSQ